MEGLSIRSYIICFCVLIAAAFVYFKARPGPVAGHTESWMERIAPAKVADYTFEPNMQGDDPLCTYKSPKMVYDTLAPTVGILGRVYQSRGLKYDVELIASRDKGSFHDPRVCFTAQKYDILDEHEIMIPTKTRGKIPATFAQMNGPEGPTVAVYFYRGPHGFYGNTTKMKFSMLWQQVKGESDMDGVFYRFIPLNDASKEDLVAFIGNYMDSAYQTSKGYF